MVQEALLRAYKFLAIFMEVIAVPGSPLCAIRYTWLRQNRTRATEEFDETLHDVARAEVNPETLLLQDAQQQLLRQALEALPVAFREVVIMRDMRGCRTKTLHHGPAIRDGHRAWRAPVRGCSTT